MLLTKQLKHSIPYVLLLVIVIAGFLFRLKGIQDNHSFWADEAFAASLGRDIVTARRTPFEAMKLLNYQPLHVLTTAASMKFFGLNEFAARLPVVLFGALGIIVAFLLAKKLSDEYGGLLAAFLYAFSQLNLAHHTQAKPNAAIQTILLFNLYLLTFLKKRENNYYLHGFIIILSSIATLFHFLGILVFIPYFIFLLRKINLRRATFNVKNLVIFLSFSAIFLTVFFFASGTNRVNDFFQPGGFKILFYYNNITYLRELLWKNYAFIVLPAILGFLATYKKNRTLTTAVIVWIFVLLYFWTFRAFRNIRYLLPLFGILIVYFAVFWSQVGEKVLERKSWLVCLVVAVLMYAGGYKIVRMQSSYYNPNQDLYGDIQIADYKTAFSLIKERFPDLSQRAIFNDWYEAQSWYLPQKKVDAYFLVGTEKPYHQTIDNAPVYGRLQDFLKEKNKYKKGALIVEDWQSLLPEEIKQYAKKNMKLEFRVESLPQAKDDPWPIEVYRWDNLTK